MNIIDTHAHLYLKQFNEDIDQVIQRANENGVKKFIFPAIDSSHFNEIYSMCVILLYTNACVKCKNKK